MASTQRFFSAAGNIIPSSIFDKGDAEMDVSEEAEEMRELLYELIKNHFPKGVTATHLAEKYKEEYVSCGMGLPLPDNWLRQVAAAEEFEVQQRGPISILFIRLKDEPPRLSAALPIVDPAQTEFTSAAPKVEAPKIKVVSPLDIAKKLRPQRVDVGGSPRAVVVSATPNRARPLYLRPVDVEPRLALLRKEMKEHYGSGDHPRLEDSEIHVGGAYAVEDLNGDWLRVALTATHADRTVDARWLDGGSRTGYPRSALRRLDEKWTGDSWPLAAVAVSLVLPDAAWSHPDLVKQLTRLVFDNDAQGNLTPTGLSARFVREVKNQEWAFEVELQTSKGVKIAEDLLSALGIEASSQPVKPILAEDSKPVTPQIWSAASPTPTTTSSTGGVDFDAAFDIVPLPVEAMPRGVFQAHALFASGPADMTLRQASLDPMPDYLYQRLALESETPEAKLMSGEPVVGGCYAARVDGRWERVRCVRASNIDRRAFCVYLVDVGAFHYVRGDELRRLNARSPFTKMLCFKCKLHGVRPVGGMDVWSREAQLLIGEALAANAGRPLEVTPRGQWSTWKQHNAPAVPLIEASLRVADVDLAEALLRVGLAVKAVKDPN